MSETGEVDGVLLLDTHIWVWAVHGESSKVGRTIPGIVAAAARAGRVRISAVSVWEAGYAISRGRIPIRGTLEDWIADAVKLYGGQVRSFDRAIALESARLPGPAPTDPGDRFLIATARLLGARLVTADHKIVRYGETGHVDVLDARP